MTETQFLAKLTEIMDTEAQITLETRLFDLEDWDSLSMVGFYSYCSTLGKKISPEAIKSARTVEDLYNLAEGKA